MTYQIPAGSHIVLLASRHKVGVREPNGDLVEIGFNISDKDELCEGFEVKRFPAEPKAA